MKFVGKTSAKYQAKAFSRLKRGRKEILEMPNRNKERGDRAERAALKSALDNGHDAKRTRAGYERDAGDLHLLTPAGKVVAQVKDCKAYSWPAWFKQLDAQVEEAGATTGFLWVKRPGMGDAGEWLAVMPARDMLKLLNQTTS